MLPPDLRLINTSTGATSRGSSKRHTSGVVSSASVRGRVDATGGKLMKGDANTAAADRRGSHDASPAFAVLRADAVATGAVATGAVALEDSAAVARAGERRSATVNAAGNACCCCCCCCAPRLREAMARRAVAAV